MAAVVRACRKCGAKIFSDAPEGLCTGCVLETALNILPDAVPAGEDDELVNRPMRESATSRSHHFPDSRFQSVAMLGELGDYELLEEVGRGGQGVVFRARQKSLNRIVALKVIGVGQWATPAHLRRFRLEAEAAASLDHPCIVPIYEIGERDGQCYFSMKFIEGGQLDEVTKHSPMSIRQAVELVAKVARTVHYAHEHGILHRDIKPGNILLDKEREPHLTDFGLARLVESESTVTRTVEVLGTPSYMAPEQASGGNTKITNATDVYGLGAVLYQVLTGHPPFAGGTTYETIKLLLETEPRQPRLWNSKLDRDVSTICLKCLEKDSRCRYSSALALAQDLERWLRHEPIQARHISALARARKWLQRNPTSATLVALSVALVAAFGVILSKSELFQPAASGIAVLPFENLSNDREDASFADGIQDDLLTKLAKIASLKVISRTSLMNYRDQHNTRQIAEALGVSHVLEGSVRKTGAWLHMNVQLIDAGTDSHVWAEEYDRDVKDMFTVQSEVAQKVAAKLHARISSTEKVAIARAPTADLTAFDLYSRARNLILAWSFNSNEKANLFKAADLLTAAVEHDRSFFQAYCQLVWVHDQLYLFRFDHTPERLALADAAVESAFRLRPNAGETHLARGWNLYGGHRDYDGALAEIQTASQSLTNEARLFELKGYVERRRPNGRLDEALRSFQRAVEIDPRNVLLLQQTALCYNFLRRYKEQAAVVDKLVAIQPDSVERKTWRAFIEFDWKGDTRPLHGVIDSVRSKNRAMISRIAEEWLICALAEHDADAAVSALAALGENNLGNETIKYSPGFLQGLIARMTNDNVRAQSAFAAARVQQEKLVQAHPDDAGALCVLGLIDAALGRKEQALREGRRAVELVPVDKDAKDGPRIIGYFANIAAWAGEKDLACQQLATSLRYPGPLSYGQLKLLPWWDSLRGNACFENLVASMAPK